MVLQRKRIAQTVLVGLLSFLTSTKAFSSCPSFTGSRSLQYVSSTRHQHLVLSAGADANDESTQTAQADAASNAPVLNGKRVLPYKILMAGLKGYQVAGVYAVLNSEYKRGYAGWENCEYIGVSMDLDATLQGHLEDHGPEKVAHIRALSFVVPSQGAMDDVADEWRREVIGAGGTVLPSFDKDAVVLAAIEAAIPYDDDDDEDDDEEFMAMTAEALAMGASSSSPTQDDGQIHSPFESNDQSSSKVDESTTLQFTKENVDKVLDEVRPYLIADGGNVSVEKVDEDKKDIYLVLEGACGSCPSSTVTMQMGIERVLKEKFADIGEIHQVQDGVEEDAPTELTMQQVEDEVNRIKPAIIAMGGFVNVASANPETGIVEVEFRGGSKVQQGLELAIMDLEFVNDVQFIEPTFN